MFVLDYALMNLSPSWLQIIFIERVVAIAKKEWAAQADQVLQSEAKGGVRTRRSDRPLDTIRNARLDLLRLQRAYQQVSKIAELLGSHSRAHYSNFRRRYSHVG